MANSLARRATTEPMDPCEAAILDAAMDLAEQDARDERFAHRVSLVIAWGPPVVMSIAFVVICVLRYWG